MMGHDEEKKISRAGVKKMAVIRVICLHCFESNIVFPGCFSRKRIGWSCFYWEVAGKSDITLEAGVSGGIKVSFWISVIFGINSRGQKGIMFGTIPPSSSSSECGCLNGDELAAGKIDPT